MQLLCYADGNVTTGADIWIAHCAKAARKAPDASFFGGTIGSRFEVGPSMYANTEGTGHDGQW